VWHSRRWYSDERADEGNVAAAGRASHPQSRGVHARLCGHEQAHTEVVVKLAVSDERA